MSLDVYCSFCIFDKKKESTYRNIQMKSIGRLRQFAKVLQFAIRATTSVLHVFSIAHCIADNQLTFGEELMKSYNN